MGICIMLISSPPLQFPAPRSNRRREKQLLEAGGQMTDLTVDARGGGSIFSPLCRSFAASIHRSSSVRFYTNYQRISHLLFLQSYRYLLLHPQSSSATDGLNSAALCSRWINFQLALFIRVQIGARIPSVGGRMIYVRMSEICQLCHILGHTAQTCPALHNRCNVPNCDGVMIRHNCDGRMFFKCHRETCLGYFLCVEVADSHLVDTLTPCQVCGLNGHQPYECPCSMPFHGPNVDTNQLPELQIQEDEEPTRYTLHQDPVCQICYDLGHNARTCTWLQQRCFTPNCDGPWIFYDIGADQPLQAYNRECTGYKHIGMVTHDQINSPIELLSCQLCGAYGHAVYQCSDLLSLYHENDERDRLSCELCGVHGHELQACPDVLAFHSELEEEDGLSTSTNPNNNMKDVPP